jgi:hypothetical protein
MNPDKAKIKLSLLASQGNQWDDWLEGQERVQHEMAGAIMVLRQAREKVFAPIQAVVAADLLEGKFASMGAAEVKAYVFKQLERAQFALENMQMNAEREKIVSEGRAAQLRDVVAVTKKAFDAEQVALTEFQKQAEAGQAEPDGRPAMTPAEDIAQRRAVAQAAKAPTAPKAAPKGKHRKGANGAAHT